jgi:hypothetical protein
VKPVTIPVTELRTGDLVITGNRNETIKLGALLDHRDKRERAFAVGHTGASGGSYVTWRWCGEVTVMR